MEMGIRTGVRELVEERISPNRKTKDEIEGMRGKEKRIVTICYVVLFSHRYHGGWQA